MMAPEVRDPPPAFPLKRVVRSPDNTYFTYPHSNGFLPDGTCVLASPTSGAGNPGLDYIAFKPDTGAAARLTHSRDARPYYSIAQNGLMLVSQRFGAAVVDLSAKDAAPRSILNDPEWTVAGDNDISPDGKRALLTRSHYKTPQDFRTDIIDIASGAIGPVIQPGWQMDHAHFSPYDPAWVSFCDNRTEKLDRLWIWNAQAAPQGRHLFDQVRPDKTWFEIGHERAMFDRPSLLVVVYGGHGTARPRGLYEVGFDGAVRLVSESNRDLHCNISRDGRWAVVSLQGMYDPVALRPLGTWLNTGLGYGFSDVMLVNMRTGARRFLYRGTNATSGQPYEVQPTISPDGRWVLLKDAREQKVLFLELDQDALKAFLA